jgi:hypothetical protein
MVNASDPSSPLMESSVVALASPRQTGQRRDLVVIVSSSCEPPVIDIAGSAQSSAEGGPDAVGNIP